MKKLYLYSRFIILLTVLLLNTKQSTICSDLFWEVSVLNNPAPGYLKFDWLNEPFFYLVDNYGSKIYENAVTESGTCYYKLLNNGLWINIAANRYYLFDQNMILIDSIATPEQYSTDLHEIELLSNGHYLLLCKEIVTMDLSQIVEGGQSNASVISNVLIETDPSNTIYWEWRAIDHLNITDVTDDIDLTTDVVDFTHINSFAEDLDGNILVSTRHLDEITKVNHTTGDIMWRLGGTTCKNNQFTFVNDNENNFQGFSHQHSISVLSNGNILMYDNGNLKNPQYSRAVEYSLNQVNKVATKVWEYRQTPDFFQNVMGSAIRLPNGNTLINWGANKITEVKPDNTIAFELRYLDGMTVYRAYRYVTRMDAVKKNITTTGNYDFSNQDFRTDVKIDVNSLNQSGSLTLEKHYYFPESAHFTDTSFTDVIPLRWVLTMDNISSLSGTFRIDTRVLNGINPQKVTIYKRSQESKGFFQEIPTSYNGTNEISANFTNGGEFVLCSNILKTPTLIYPSNNDSLITINDTLKWNKLKGANKYHVQISRYEDFTNLIVNDASIIDNKYSSFILDYNTDYYWRVRGFNSKDTSKWSTPYHFSTEKFLTPMLIYPDNGRVSVELSESLRWTEVPKATKYWIQVSLDHEFKELVVNKSNILKDTFLISELEENTDYFWRVAAVKNTYKGNWSESYCFTTRIAKPKILNPEPNIINLDNIVHFKWKSVKGAEKYKLEVSESSSFNNLIINEHNIKDTNYTFTELQRSKDYYWRLRAYNFADSSRWTETNSFSTLLETPKLTYPANNENAVPVNSGFQWNPVKGANSYQLQISYSADFNKSIYNISDIKTNNYKYLDLPPESTVYWRVKAFNNNKFSDWSEIWNIKTGKRIPLSTPKLISPKNNTNNETVNELSWLQIDRASNYHLIIAIDEGFSSIILDTLVKDFVINDVYSFQQELHYYWKVKAVSLFDSSQYSDTWIFSINNHKPIVKLLKPENDEMQVPVNSQMKWEKVNIADSYNIQLSENSVFEDLIMDSTVNSTELSFNNLKNRQLYYWRVRFLDNTYTSEWSAVWTFTTKSEIILEKPILLSPIDNKKSISINSTLSWTGVDKASSYNISLSKDKNFNTIDIKISDITDTHYDLSDIEYNKKYYWRVSATNPNSLSDWSDIGNFTSELVSPTIVSPNFNAINQPTDGKLIWSIEEDIALYNIQISLEPDFVEPFLNVEDIYELSYEYLLFPNTHYYWKVKANCSDNYSKWSSVYQFTTGNYSGVFDEKMDNKSIIYPNPTTEYIHIDNEYVGLNYSIYSLEGILITKGLVNASIINVKELCPGLYILKIDTEYFYFVKI